MEIYVLDRDINILNIVSTYDAIVWNTKLSEPGTFKAEFIFTPNMNSVLQCGNLLYKTDDDETAIITKRDLKLNKYGEETIQVQGYMASRYLYQRIIWGKMIMTGSPEEVMRKMVYEQLINPEDTSRKMERIQLGELQGYEGHIEKQISFNNLQETLTDIANTTELGYRLRLDISSKKFYFEVYRGTDRTRGTEYPCVFSRTYGNIDTQEYSEDYKNYRNVCLVGGAGEDEDRIMTTVGAAAGLDRYETFCNAGSISNKDITEDIYISQLNQKGEEMLAKYRITQAFESKINSAKEMNCTLGDYVTCVDEKWNVMMDKQIKGIQKGYSKKEKSIVATFGDIAPTLVALIKAKE